jgi:transposase
MKENYVGIDISKETLDYDVKRVDNLELLGACQTKNSLAGMAKMIRQLKKQGIDPCTCHFCIEHTGAYGLLLSSFLESKGYLYSAVPALEIKRSIGVQRGKSDAIDAGRIAQYAYTHRETLKQSKLPGTAILAIKELMSHRSLLVKMSTQLKNKLSVLKVTQDIVDSTFVKNQVQAQLAVVQKQLKELEEEIHKELQSDEQIRKNYKLVRSIKGFGLVIAAYLIVSTGNFTRFENARKYNCYAGIAPFEHSSGSSYKGRTRISKLGDRTIKILLYNGAHSAIQWDPGIAAYYHCKKEENKQHGSIVNAVACKLIARAFAVVKRGTPYVNTYEENLNINLVKS